MENIEVVCSVVREERCNKRISNRLQSSIRISEEEHTKVEHRVSVISSGRKSD